MDQILCCFDFGSKPFCFDFRSVKKSIHSVKAKILQDQIKTLRTSMKLSQRELALRLGKNHGTVAKIELGERRIDVIEYFELLKAVGVDPIKEASHLMKMLRDADG